MCFVSSSEIKKGGPPEAVLEIKYRRLRVMPPSGKRGQYPALTLTVLYAVERRTPKNPAGYPEGSSSKPSRGVPRAAE